MPTWPSLEEAQVLVTAWKKPRYSAVAAQLSYQIRSSSEMTEMNFTCIELSSLRQPGRFNQIHGWLWSAFETPCTSLVQIRGLGAFARMCERLRPIGQYRYEESLQHCRAVGCLCSKNGDFTTLTGAEGTRGREDTKK